MNLVKSSNLKKPFIVVVICLSMLFFLISLFLPVFNMADGDVFDGLNVLLLGWIAIFELPEWGLGAIGWYVNPLLLIVWLGLLRPKFRVAGRFALLISIGIAPFSFQLIHQTVMVSTGGVNTSEIVSIGIGFYVWLAAFVICLFGYIAPIVFDLIHSKKTT